MLKNTKKLLIYSIIFKKNSKIILKQIKNDRLLILCNTVNFFDCKQRLFLLGLKGLVVYFNSKVKGIKK